MSDSNEKKPEIDTGWQQAVVEVHKVLEKIAAALNLHSESLAMLQGRDKGVLRQFFAGMGTLGDRTRTQETRLDRMDDRIDAAVQHLDAVLRRVSKCEHSIDARLESLEIVIMRTASRTDAIEERLGSDRIMEGERLRLRVSKLEKDTNERAIAQPLREQVLRERIAELEENNQKVLRPSDFGDYEARIRELEVLYASLSNRVESTDMVVVADRDRFTAASELVLSSRADVSTLRDRLESLEASDVFKSGLLDGMSSRDDDFAERIETLEKLMDNGGPQIPDWEAIDADQAANPKPEVDGNPDGRGVRRDGPVLLSGYLDLNPKPTDDSNGDKGKE